MATPAGSSNATKAGRNGAAVCAAQVSMAAASLPSAKKGWVENAQVAEVTRPLWPATPPAATGSSCCSSRELDSRARVAKASAPRSSPTVLNGTGSSVLT
ncbi:hypothetical protein G6N84_21285 [Xanthomonas oryzae pv. oryzae]|nr:hypothetical protein G6N84_21285 [Xanthomonas oryzae pv. oryzae]